MCLMLYIGTQHELPPRDGEWLTVEEVDAERAAVQQWFSSPHVRFVGAHTGCSCGFPSVVADEPVAFHEGLFDETSESRRKDLQSVRELLALVASVPGDVELLGVWDGDQFDAPAGVIELRMDAIEPEKFFFTQRFLYRVLKTPPADS